MREFLSKSVAGGLSAGVVLLWWPLLFNEVDTVTSWFVRGVAWTVVFELLLVALIPFERALWETARGERISSRVGAAGSRLHAGSPRKRIGRLSAVATLAVAVPAALLATGLQQHAPAEAEAKAVKPVKVVRVTKVVKVKRIVQRAPISGQRISTPVPTTTAAPVQSQAAPAPAPQTKAEAPEGGAVVGRTAPVQRESVEETSPAPAERGSDSCEGDACGSATSPAPAPSF